MDAEWWEDADLIHLAQERQKNGFFKDSHDNSCSIKHEIFHPAEILLATESVLCSYMVCFALTHILKFARIYTSFR